MAGQEGVSASNMQTLTMTEHVPDNRAGSGGDTRSTGRGNSNNSGYQTRNYKPSHGGGGRPPSTGSQNEYPRGGQNDFQGGWARGGHGEYQGNRLRGSRQPRGGGQRGAYNNQPRGQHYDQGNSRSTYKGQSNHGNQNYNGPRSSLSHHGPDQQRPPLNTNWRSKSDVGDAIAEGVHARPEPAADSAGQEGVVADPDDLPESSEDALPESSEDALPESLEAAGQEGVTVCRDAPATGRGKGGSRARDKKDGGGRYQQPGDARRNEGNQRTEVSPHIAEINGDLFTASSDFSLAHCVAADLRMGSGIAVGFRDKFKRLNELLDQYKGVGQVAILEDNGRYLYYLITKQLSRSKPTMHTLRQSLEAMKQHCVDRGVTKLAMPRIGCGLDRLDWFEVRALLKEVFAGTAVSITVYNFPQADEERDVDFVPKKKSALFITHKRMNLVTIEPKTGLLYFCSEETIENKTSVSLDEKHRFFQVASKEKRELGKVVRTEVRHEVFYGLVIRKREKDRVSYTAMMSCVKQLRKLNDKDQFEYMGVEAFRDGKDAITMEKFTTVLRNMLAIIQHRLEVWICWPEEFAGDHDWSLDAPPVDAAAAK